ncbi:hypothetical protein [Pajaroellobacter abortibovis]|uniref:hypothetical protein n=1 Tax=Pajaroellobacter abortibovis TaxID=1882918 RepID=UPI0012EC8D45|nr:hypothetical protein [Pajaroellobacter abortibovis]
MKVLEKQEDEQIDNAGLSKGPKPYSSPKLRYLGTVYELTQGGTGTRADSGLPGRKR